jgi:hypothetical protein
MRWRTTVATVLVVAAVAVPAATAGATQTVETWSHVSGDLFFAGDGLCGTTEVAGYLVDGSGVARTTEAPNGGVYVRGYSDDTYELWEASGPPWDVTFGAPYGTLTVHTPFDELATAGGQEILGSVATGRLTRPDGSWQTVHILFRMLIQPDSPPKLFLVRFTCGG